MSMEPRKRLRVCKLFCFLIIFLCSLKPTNTFAQVEPWTKVVFVMDGSGSIDSADFQLQKDGIIAALQNPLVIPLDGTIAVALVQFGGGTTRIEVPYTIIGNVSDVSTVVSQIRAFSQIRSSTNPGDGINRAMSLLNSVGHSTASESICMSTDGLRNSGASPSSAIANATTDGLDRFGVVAIEDPPFYYATDFHNAYDLLVFGGGNVTVVRNAAEFANTVGPTCLPSDLELIGLEAIQTIQDWSNSVQLIEGKTTYVRAHIQTMGTNPALAVARLRGFRGGVELQGSPLTAINPGGSIAAEQNAADRRGQFNSSLNFQLPQTWLNGTVELRVEGIGSGLDCQEVVGTPNDCSVEVTFNSTDEPEVRFVAVQWTDAGGTTHNPSAADLTELANRMIAIYPTSDLDWTTGSLNWTDAVPPNLSDVNSRIKSMRFWDACWSIWPFNCDRIYYGVLRGPDQGGLGFMPGSVSSGTMPAGPFVYGRNRHAHEIGHNLGRDHAAFCGATSAETFPYTAQIGGQTVATLGPMNLGQDRLIFGFDTHEMVVIDPNQNFELMSYCGSWRWISKFTYDAIRTASNNSFDTSSSSDLGPIQDYMVVRGMVDFENNTVEFMPVGTISSPVFPPLPPVGDYTLQMQDEIGNVVTDISFQPIEFSADYPAETPGTGMFLIPVLADQAIKGATVVHNGSTLASISASPNPPSVQVLFPNGGENLSDAQVTFQWTGTDMDGDSLTYLVQYSQDGGASWETLIADWSSETYTIELKFLESTNNGLIRVMASDGFNTATDESDGPFSVPNNPPDVNVISPTPNELFVGVQLIYFEGEARDREDGKLSGSSLTWTSSIDGFLGTGGNFTKMATDFSEGNHLITLTATDSAGLTNTTSVNIRIYRLAPPGGEPPIADAGLDQALACDSPAGTTTTLDGTGSSDPDGDPLTYLWSAPGIGFDDPTSPTPVATFPLGTTQVDLEVEDGNDGTDNDEVLITVQDTTPPDFTFSVSPTTLWPPNHKMVLITPSWTVNDVCDESVDDVSLVSITMNEGEEANTFEPTIDDTQGDGHTFDDIQIIDGSIYLRAERSGTGDGRVYTIKYKAVDDSGNVTEKTATVTVPHNQ